MRNDPRAQVRVREDQSLPMIAITSPKKPDIPDSFLEKWQELADIVARILKVPASLIMKLHEGEIEVFVRSQNQGNPYQLGEKAELGMGLYCETAVAKNDQLLVPDARQDPVWRDNPDVDLGMISYLGLPIRWPDSEVFGTICALDNKPNSYSEDFASLLSVLRQLLEKDLELLLAYENACEDSRTDTLTGLANRRTLNDCLEQEFSRFQRYGNPVSLIMFDIDNFKRVNDNFGHDAGDDVLKAISTQAGEVVRDADIIGRWGGEEFLVICPDTDVEGARLNAEKLRRVIENYDFEDIGTLTCSFGVASIHTGDSSASVAIKRADEAMYAAKAAGKNRVHCYQAANDN